MDKLKEEITKRYDNEKCDNLSCGNNFAYAKIKQGEVVLDLGCGSGKDLVEAALLVGKQGKVIGLDISNDMIEKARKRIADSSYDNIDLINSELEDIRAEDDSIDVVLSNCAINHAVNKSKVYGEIYRILRPGGRFIVSDIASIVPLPQEIKEDPAAWAQCFGGAVTETEYLDMLEKTKFGMVTVLKRREYKKNGYDFVSLTLMGIKYNCFACSG